MADQWFYEHRGKRTGPISPADLKQMADSGQLSPDDIIWKEGMPTWVSARTLKGLFPPRRDEEFLPEDSTSISGKPRTDSAAIWTVAKSIINKSAGSLTILIGTIAGLLLISSSSSLAVSSRELMQLRSVGGQSVAEAYYQQVGHIQQAYSNAIFAAGLFVISLSLGIGSWLITRE
jgi:hypothetical protein